MKEQFHHYERYNKIFYLLMINWTEIFNISSDDKFLLSSHQRKTRLNKKIIYRVIEENWKALKRLQHTINGKSPSISGLMLYIHELRIGCCCCYLNNFQFNYRKIYCCPRSKIINKHKEEWGERNCKGKMGKGRKVSECRC